jgi:RNA-binding protein YhbY
LELKILKNNCKKRGHKNNMMEISRVQIGKNGVTENFLETLKDILIVVRL